MSVARHAALLAAVLLWAPAAWAQTASSSLTGTVQGRDGAPVEAAVVQARSEATGAVRTAVTDDRGRYRLELLHPGEWTIVARLVDGRLSDARVVALRLQQTTRLDFTVSTGSMERVVVTAEAPLVDRKQTAGKLRITGTQADALPLSGRVFTDLALLDSSVRQAAPGNFFGERGSVFVVNGQSGRSNSFLVDGLDNNDSTSGTSTNSFFSQQVIQEFVLLTHQYSPEFGRASGGVLNIVTRQGSNERAWDAFAQGTASDWNETGSFVESLPDRGESQEAVRRYQAGLSFSGPIREDRAFYFAAYEHQRSDAVIPYTGVDAAGIAGGRFVAPSANDNFFLRTDFNLGSSTTLMARLSGDLRSIEGVNVGGVWTPEAGFRIEERDAQFAATLSSVVSPNLLSETRLLATTSEFDQFANSDRVGVSRPDGIHGGNILNRQERNEDKVQLVQNLTWTRGPHTMKFGLDVTHSRTDISARFNPNGLFTYDWALDELEPGDCGDLLPSQGANIAPNGQILCVLDPNGIDDDGDGTIDELGNFYTYPLHYSLIIGEPEATLDDTAFSVFVQDRFEAGRRWLLEYGLRYDLSTYELPDSARVDSTIPNGGAGRDTDNLAPRFGFTFTPKPGGKLVVRGGGGVFYDKLVLAFPAVAAITSDTRIGLFFPQGFAEEFTEDDVTGGAINPLLFPDPLTLRFSTAPELETPYTVQYNLGFDTPIGRSAALRANVVRALGYHLPLMRDLNPVSGLVSGIFGLPLLAGTLTECPVDQIDPDLDIGVPCHARDPATGSIAALVTEGRSWYTGFDVNFRWQRDDQWVNASYTMSRAEDTGFDPLKGGISLPPNSGDLGRERGRADGDRLHRLVLSGQRALPWMGLRASGVLQVSSGIPYDVTTGQDDNLDGILTDRPLGVGRNDGADASIAAVNAARIQEVVPLLPIVSLPEPSFFQVDLRLSRPFALKKGGGELFLQIFNLLDRQNEGLIEGRALSASLGRPISLAGPPRTLEFGLRFGY